MWEAPNNKDCLQVYADVRGITRYQAKQETFINRYFNGKSRLDGNV
jgi:hypothetical protein